MSARPLVDRARSAVRKRTVWVGWILVVALVCGGISFGSGRSVSTARAADTQGVVTPPEGGVEDVSLRTRTSDSFVMPSGAVKAEIFSGSINYWDDQGGWQPIDNRAVASKLGGYAFENAANSYHVLFPQDLAKTPIRLEADKAWATFGLQGAGGAPRPAGTVVTYADALRGVDLRYMISGDAVKESVVFASADAVVPLVFSISVSPGVAAKQGAQGIDFVDSSGARVFSLAAPSIEDATGEEAGASAVGYELAPSGDNAYALTVTVDRQWISDPARTFPVVLDPTTTLTEQQDCYIVSGSSHATNWCHTDKMRIGYASSGGQIRHGLLKFDTSSLPDQITVTDADLALYCFNGSTTTSAAYDLRRVARDWTDDATWDNYDATHAWTTGGGGIGTDVGSTVYDSVSTNCSSAATKHWHPTQLVQYWADGTYPNQGLMIRQSTDSTNNYVDFASMENTTYPTLPSLTVTYWHRYGIERDWTYVSQRLNDRMDMRVNVANGNMVLHAQDLHVDGTGLDLSVDRYFNSRSSVSAPDFGTGSWQMGQGSGVSLTVEPNGDVQLNQPSGTRVRFVNQGSGVWTTPAGVDATLSQSSGLYKLTFNDLTVWDFDSNNNLATVTDKNKNVITYNHGGANLTGITDTQGRSFSFTRTSGNITAMTDTAGSRRWGYAYDGTGRLHTYTDAEGHDTVYDYDTNDRITKITDPRGNMTTITYSSSRVATITRVTNPTTMTGPTTTFAYPSINATTCDTAHNDAIGETTVTDDNSHTTTYCWNKRSQVVRVVDARGITESHTYNADAANLTNFSQLDGAGTDDWLVGFNSGSDDRDLSSIALPSSGTSAEADVCYPNHNTNTTRCPNGGTSPDHFPTAVYGFSNHTTSTPNGTYTYDARGNMLTAANPNDGTTTYTWSTPAGFTNTNSKVLTDIEDPDHNHTVLSYDSAGNLTGVNPPGSDGTIAVTYDAVSRIQTLTDARGIVATYTYDDLDRVKTVTYSDSTPDLSFDYDNNGNLTGRTDAVGTWAFTYDELNRKLTENPPGTTDPTITYGYDGVGNLHTIQDGWGTTTYLYNEVNKVRQVEDPDGAQTTIAYQSGSNRRDYILYPNNVKVSTTWTKAGQMATLSAVTAGGSGTTLLSRSYDYTDPVSPHQDQVLLNKVTDQAGNVTSYTYNQTERIKEALTKNSGGTTTEDILYNLYNNEGNLTSMTKGSTTTLFDYTGTGSPDELVCLHTAATCDHTNANTIWYAYDADGNQTSRATSAGTTSLSYNGRNVLKSNSATFAGGGQAIRTDQGNWHFTYTQLGLNVDSSPSITRNYVRSDDGGLLEYKKNSNKFYYILDNQENVIGVTDGSGTLPQTYKYDPYGNDDGSSGAAQPWRYASGYLDTTSPTNDQYKFGTRFYDPVQARWTQTDPKAGKLTMPTSMNPYLYVGDDPVNGTDPTGQFSSIEVALLAETCAEFGGLAFAVTGNPVVGVVGCVVSVTAEAALTGLLDDLLL